MSIGRIGRIGRLARVSKGGDVLGGHDILTGTDSGGQVLITTAQPHGLAALQDITISGASVAGYNGAQTVGSVISATSFLIAELYTEDSTGGRWVLT